MTDTSRFLWVHCIHEQCWWCMVYAVWCARRVYDKLTKDKFHVCAILTLRIYSVHSEHFESHIFIFFINVYWEGVREKNDIRGQDIVFQFDSALIDFLFINFCACRIALILNAYDFTTDNIIWYFRVDFLNEYQIARVYLLPYPLSLFLSFSLSHYLTPLFLAIFRSRRIHFIWKIENKTRRNNRFSLAFRYRSNRGYCFQMTCTKK